MTRKVAVPVAIGLTMLLSLVLWGRGQAAPALQGTNLLLNPSFEQPFNAGGEANGWGRWHEDTGKKDCSERYVVLPQWSQESNSALVTDGSTSQHVGNMWDTWHAGVMQNVTVTPGSRYRFTFYGRGRASNDQYPAPSDTSISLGVKAGIDPNGSGLWYEGDIVWSATYSPHDQNGWQVISVEATASGSQVTVFAQADFSNFQCRAAHYDIWFDKAELIEIGPPPTNTPLPTNTFPPPPPATNTPVPPTAAPTLENSPVPTDTPIPTNTPTATPEPGGTICVNAFADANANGLHEAAEGYMAGVTFSVVADGQAVSQGVSPGTANAVCFEGLDPGSYQVVQTVPETLDMTTAGDITIDVTEGQTIGLEFGSRPKPVQVATDTPPATEMAAGALPTGEPGQGEPTPAAPEDDQGGFDILAISGLAVMVLAVVLLIALIFILLRQQTR